MSKQRVRQTVTVKVRRKKVGGNSGYKKCPRCGGDGRIKVK